MPDIRPLLRYIAPAFSYDKSETCHLRLQVAADELAITVYDPLPAAFMLLEKYPVQKGYAGIKPHQAIARILHDHQIGRCSWKKVEVISMSPIYTLVPASIGQGLDPALQLDLVHTHQADRRMESTRISALDILLMYAWSSEMAETVKKYFPVSVTNHYLFHLFQGLLSSTGHGITVTAHVHGFHLDVIVIKDSKLLFCNLFHFQNQDDFIYFLLLVFDRLGLDREKVALQLSGEIESGSALYNLCFRYFRIINFFARDQGYPVPAPEEGTDQLSLHAYYSLLHPVLENY